MSTVHKLLTELEKAEEEAEAITDEAVTKEIIELAMRLSKRLRADAYAELMAAKESMGEVVRGAAAVKQEYEKKLGDRDARIGEVESENEKLAKAVEGLKEDLESSRLELVKVRESNEGLRSALEEREKALVVAEKRAGEALAALEHFRGAVRDQREQIERDRDGQVGALQAEIRGLRAAMSVKLDELRGLSEQNAAMAQEIRLERAKAIELERKAEALEEGSGKLLEALSEKWGDGFTLMRELRDRLLIQADVKPADLKQHKRKPPRIMKAGRTTDGHEE